MTATESQALNHVYYEPSKPSVRIEALVVDDLAVVNESRRWSTGQRTVPVDDAGMERADLSPFVTQALRVGALAISTAGGAQDAYNLDRLVADVGERTSAASEQAAIATASAVGEASKLVAKASTDAQKAILDVGKSARVSFTEDIGTAKKALQEELRRLVGGEHPEFLARLQPIVEKFGRDLELQGAKQTGELFTKAAKQFDPDDPTSPMSKHTRELQKQNDALKAALEKNHKDLEAKVEQLTTAVQVTTSATNAAQATAKVTPLKGHTYADGVHRIMAALAPGLGDEYTDTSAAAGAIARCKKGDGLLTIDGGTARVVLEMSDSTRTTWNDYLDECERNRGATASLGLVRCATQLNGEGIRVFGSRRIVIAFNPETDSPDLLRAVVQLLRIAALTASSRTGVDDVKTAEEKLTEAMNLLGRLASIRNSAGLIRQHANKVENGCESLQTSLNRLLEQARSALEGVTRESPVDSAA